MPRSRLRTSRLHVEDVASGIADKLVARHPYVFATPRCPATHFTWEHARRREGTHLGAAGDPEQLSALARAHKIISRARSRRVEWIFRTAPVSADQLGASPGGAECSDLVARAQAQGIDPDQALRDAVRQLEQRVRGAEATGAG